MFVAAPAAESLPPETAANVDPDHPLYGQVMVFTGALSIHRKEAWAAVAACGAIVEKGVNKRTTMLVVGDGFTGHNPADFCTGKAVSSIGCLRLMQQPPQPRCGDADALTGDHSIEDGGAVASPDQEREVRHAVTEISQQSVRRLAIQAPLRARAAEEMHAAGGVHLLNEQHRRRSRVPSAEEIRWRGCRGIWPGRSAR
jgi:hypothetical protein